MNILFISEYYPPFVQGGGEINVSLTTAALARKGVKVSVLTSALPGVPEQEQRRGVTIYRRAKTGSNPRSWSSNLQRSLLFPYSVIQQTKKLFQECPERSFDVIHFIGTSVIAAPALKRLGVPLIATVESFPTLCPKGNRFYQERQECTLRCSYASFLSCQYYSSEMGLMENKAWLKLNPFILTYIYHYFSKLRESLAACHCVAISSYVQGLLARHDYPSTVIPNGIEILPHQSIKTSGKRGGKTVDRAPSALLRKKKTNVLYLGSLTRFKGPQFLLSAAQGLPLHCDLYGDGLLKEELQRQIEHEGLDAQIHASVPYEHLPDVYARADLVIVPSLWPEPFGRIAIEAMAIGKPVIASAVGALPEIIGEGGILCPPGNVPELRQALLDLGRNEKRRQELGKKGREIAQARYALDGVAEQWIGFYSRLLLKNSS